MKSISTILIVFSISVVFGQSKLDSLLGFSGSVDLYFRHNLNGANKFVDGNIAPSTAFADLSGFALGMFNLKTSLDDSNYGFVADLVFGPRGQEAVFNEEGPLSIINQLNAYYRLSDDLRMTFGAFNTFVGYEGISPVANFHYSTSYLFSYGPFNHAGLKLDANLGSGFNITGAILNPTDESVYNPTGEIYFGGQVAYINRNETGSIALNYLHGPSVNQIDLTSGFSYSEKGRVVLNTSSIIGQFTGFALYHTYMLRPKFGIGIRAEHFVVHSIDTDYGLLTDKGHNVSALTFSANFRSGNFRLIPELRFDQYSDDLIQNKNSRQASLFSVLLAGVLSF